METPEEFAACDCFIFDLDNTLYNEEDFLRFVYDKIGTFVYEKEHLEPADVSDFLTAEFKTSGRENIFQKLNARFNLKIDVAEYLSIMRSSAAKGIGLYDIYYKIFAQLKRTGVKIFVLTNGNLLQQQNKIKSINWMGFDRDIKFYFAEEYAPKPDAEAINKILRENNSVTTKTLFIGDSKSDHDCAVKAGVSFMYSYDFEKRWKM